MDKMVDISNFYKGKTILVTGHTGFKGSWLCKILIMMGANVVGFSLNPPSSPNLFTIFELEKNMVSIIGDIRDFEKLKVVFEKYKPELVFHLAAQPIVRESYNVPRYTYETNVIGTVNVCECIRVTDSVKSFLNVTTDKVYENRDQYPHPFCEDEKLDGFDPYSNSKSCSELVTHTYYRCFFKDKNVAASTARAGNVIGGGDFAKDRIIPDCVRAISDNKAVVLRHPNSTRPYQHVFEPLYCYLLINMEQYFNHCLCASYNIGPDLDCVLTTLNLTKSFLSFFTNGKYEVLPDSGPHEASFLSLNNNKMKKTFFWEPIMSINDAIKITALWYKTFLEDGDLISISENQIRSCFFKNGSSI